MPTKVIRLLPWLLSLILLLCLVYILIAKSGNSLLSWWKKNEPKTVSVHRIVTQKAETLGKLELVKYYFKDIVEYKKTKRLMPDAKATLIVSGEAVACIDLTKIKDTDVEVKGDSLWLNLPEPKLCYHKIDHEKSEVYKTEFTRITGENTIIAEAFKEAEKALEKAALESGILDEAKLRARQILVPVLENMTKKKVFVRGGVGERSTSIDKD